MRTNLLALGLMTALVAGRCQAAINVGAFGPQGQGGSKNGQAFSIGSGGSVYELDGFVSLEGQDLNGNLLGTTAQLSRDTLPAGLTYEFTSALSSDQTDLALTYTFSNTSSNSFNGVHFFLLLDAEIDQTLNTFFNEYGTVQGNPGSGGGDSAPNEWQIDEPGFQRGTLFRNLSLGSLSDTNAVPQSALNDVAMSLGFDLGTLQSGDNTSVQVLISEADHLLGSFALQQHDNAPSSTTVITLSGLLGGGGEAQVVGTVFQDANANAVPDSGEGLSGVSLVLESNQVTVAEGRTDATGRYQINAKAGTYTLTVAAGSLPGGLTLAPLNGAATNSPWPVTLTSGFPTTVNWGYRRVSPGVVRGTVFKDVDGNGIAGNGEGLTGVRLFLESNEVTIAEISTDSTGVYSFTNVAGNYRVRLDSSTLPSGYTLVSVVNGAGGNPADVALRAGGVSELNWGFQAPVLGALRGTVFWDVNTNGLPDTGEGLRGVVLLLESNEVTIAQISTDLAGSYSFTNVAGNYRVRLDSSTLPSGYTLVSVVNGAGDNPADVALRAGSVSVLNWGFQPPVFGALRGTVFWDVNTNGLPDTSEGLGGVGLQLESNQVTVAKSTTDAEGNYNFTNAPGSYTLRLDASQIPFGLTLIPVANGAANNPSSVSISANGVGILNWAFQRTTGSQFEDVSAAVHLGLTWELNRARGTLVGTLSLTNSSNSGVAIGPPYQLGLRTSADCFYPTNFGQALLKLPDGVMAVDLTAAAEGIVASGVLNPGSGVRLLQAVEIYSLTRTAPANSRFEIWATRK